STEIDKEEVMDYKVVYFLKVYNAQGDLRTFLHQATTLTQSEEGNIQHTIGIQMDVTDLKIVKNDLISFISLNDKNKSYFNIDPEQLPYDYQSKIKSNSPLKTFLSNREIEIVKLLSKGFSSKQIGVKLFISTGTVSTHRKNIRKKTGIKSTAELISRSLMEGLF
ncbi:MAG: LuxR C-terminal-related transcriptional regulator, partial [Brumimicrobium sp.]